MSNQSKRYRGCETVLEGTIQQRIANLAQRLSPVSVVSVGLSEAAGRVLGQTIKADRDSPPTDVSSVDGYAVRLGDVTGGPMPVADEVVTGQAPPPLSDGSAVRVFTGGAVPAGAEAVVRRELCHELTDKVRIAPDCVDLKAEANIRRQGENILAGQAVLEPGKLITAAQVSTMAAFGLERVSVHRPVRVAMMVTGDELRQAGQAVEATTIRDSNGPTISAMLSGLPWIKVVAIKQVKDDRSALRTHLGEALSQTDALITSGGVSMGDHDHVPDVLEDLGAMLAYHGLPIRPGRPMLGAVGSSGQLILGLPGNPVSVITTLRRFGIDLLYRLAGGVDQPYAPTIVRVTNPATQVSDLCWYRPVRLHDHSEAELLSWKGSGDLSALARSDGFIEHPADQPGSEQAKYWRWRV